ncbi:hypothetical protein ABZ371_30010 [Streptomyces sp. NPDC005899]
MAVNRLEGHRAVATRHGELAVRHGAAVLVAVLDKWLDQHGTDVS